MFDCGHTILRILCDGKRGALFSVLARLGLAPLLRVWRCPVLVWRAWFRHYCLPIYTAPLFLDLRSISSRCPRSSIRTLPPSFPSHTFGSGPHRPPTPSTPSRLHCPLLCPPISQHVTRSVECSGSTLPPTSPKLSCAYHSVVSAFYEMQGSQLG